MLLFIVSNGVTRWDAIILSHVFIMIIIIADLIFDDHRREKSFPVANKTISENRYIFFLCKLYVGRVFFTAFCPRQAVAFVKCLDLIRMRSRFFGSFIGLQSSHTNTHAHNIQIQIPPSFLPLPRRCFNSAKMQISRVRELFPDFTLIRFFLSFFF